MIKAASGSDTPPCRLLGSVAPSVVLASGAAACHP